LRQVLITKFLIKKQRMIKQFLLLIACFLTLSAEAQNKPTKEQVEAAEKLLDLQFTDAERDSMLDEVADNLLAIKTIHTQHLDNWTTPALYFDPIPSNFQPRDPQQMLNKWTIPQNVGLPANRADLAFYTLPQLASLIKNKKITSVELTQFFIERLKKYSDTLQCTISIQEEMALKQARAADEEIKKGQYRGILHGIPYGVKDLLAIKGTKTTWGATPYKDQTIEQTATVVERLNTAGAVMTVKLTLGALAMGDVWYGGKTKNPWNLLRGSSGSSAGSASAVVAGLVPFAIGSETLGSIVSPSTECGATGLRPTFGRVSRYGAMTLCWSLDKLGPITRSAEDAAIVLDAIKGVDGKDKTVKNMPFNYGKKDITKLKIGYPRELFDTLKQDRPEWQVLKTLEKLGATLTPMTFTTSVPYQIIDPILMGESAAAFDELTRTNLDDLLTMQNKYSWPNLFRAARLMPAVEYINANRLRVKMIEEIHALISQYDVIVTNNFGLNQLRITNLTGHPVVVVPTGFQNNRPTSITFLGNYFDEATILSVAKAYQDATDFDEKHPELFKK
jgi:Asp-tRNA(Asn)/Glu-tRNA(Gln) amidotransferase A subunit family amidase